MALQNVVKKNGSTIQKYCLKNTSIRISASVETKKEIQYLPTDGVSFIFKKV